MTPDPLPRRVAIVHYWFLRWRGGEKVVRSLLRLFPDADIYTLFLDDAACGQALAAHRVRTSALDHAWLRRHYQKLFPLYPWALRSLELDADYDLVISSESGPAKGVRVPPGARHLCYVHTPMRYCWEHREPYLRSVPAPLRALADGEFERLRRWDVTTADNVDYYVANSRNVADRVQRYYGRSARVVHPPIDLDLFRSDRFELPRPRGDHYLSFGAITPYKNVDVAVEATTALGRPLVVIGDGSERARIERQAGPNVRFLGECEWLEIESQVRTARALLFPGEEDFGMVPLEVMASGVPIIALGRGGALETVVASSRTDESSGVFFDAPSAASLIEAIERFESIEDEFDPAWIRAHARTFGEDVFLERMTAEIERMLAGHPS